MRKLLATATALIFIITLFTGCSIKSTDIPITRKKPTNYYYSNLLSQLIVKGGVNGSLLEMNLHKEKEFPKEGYENLIGFFKALKSDNFITKPADLPEKPKYKIFIYNGKEKYVINIYNERYASIYPWDGIYPMDYIDMSTIFTMYNLHVLCKYFFK